MKIHSDVICGVVLIAILLFILFNGVVAGIDDIVLQHNIDATYEVHK